MSTAVRMLNQHVARLRELLFQDGSERAALALCGRSMSLNPWIGIDEEQLLIKEIIAVPDSAYVERSPTGFEWSTTPFYNQLKRAEPKGFAVAVFHSHPNGDMTFSERDNIAEKELFAIAFSRLESEREHVSMIVGPDGAMRGRSYGPDLKARPIDQVTKIGERWSFERFDRPSVVAPEFNRQVRAFGRKALAQVADLKVGVVGCGGTGSAVVSLLCRVGVRQLAIFDSDYVDESNLNRLHFSTRSDANLQRKKVDVVGRGAANIGLPLSIARIPRFADDLDALRVLKNCDVVFGCTDDHLGREVLNRLAHFYYVPVLDLGLLIEPNAAGGYDAFDGRVTVVQPGYPCQTCRKLINEQQLYLDSLRRDPALLAQRRRAGYVPSDPDPSPVVVTFTTEVATMAVNEFFHRLTEFRGVEERCTERVRKFNQLKDADILAAGSSASDCRLCGERRYDGRGDMTPLLDLSL